MGESGDVESAQDRREISIAGGGGGGSRGGGGIILALWHIWKVAFISTLAPNSHSAPPQNLPMIPGISVFHAKLTSIITIELKSLS